MDLITEARLTAAGQAVGSGVDRPFGIICERIDRTEDW
jgi:hypothetical protein